VPSLGGGRGRLKSTYRKITVPNRSRSRAVAVRRVQACVMSDVCEVLAEIDVDGRSNSEFSGIGELTTSPCRPPTAGAPCEGLRRRDSSVRPPPSPPSATATLHAASAVPHPSDCLEHRRSVGASSNLQLHLVWF